MSAKASVSGAREVRPSAFFELEADPQRDREKDQRNQERKPPSPLAECVLAKRRAGADDHQQRGKQAQRRGRLDEAGVEAPALLRRMLGDVDRRAANARVSREQAD